MDRKNAITVVSALLDELGSDFNDIVAEVRQQALGIDQKAAKWREQDGIIYFSVTSDGTTGEEWITRLASKGYCVGDYAKQVLRSPDFKPTSGITTEVAVLKGLLFGDSDRITSKIRAEAKRRKLNKPNAEVACLIREHFADEEIEAMGLWAIVVMHEPIEDSAGDPSLLNANRDGNGRSLGAFDGELGRRRDRGDGLAFAVSPQ